MDQPRPPTRARLSASKMVYPLVAAFLSLSLLFSGSVGLKWQLKEGRKVGQSLCPSYPYPTVDPSTLLKILGPFLEELGQNMSSLIKSTPGGAVVSVVYRDTVIWTHADGLINMSGEPIFSLENSFAKKLYFQIRLGVDQLQTLDLE